MDHPLVTEVFWQKRQDILKYKGAKGPRIPPFEEDEDELDSYIFRF